VKNTDKGVSLPQAVAIPQAVLSLQLRTLSYTFELMIGYLKKLNKDFGILLIVLFIALMSLNALAESKLIIDYDFFVLWVVLGVLFLTLYALRFRRKPQVDLMDHFKLGAMLLAPFVPLLSTSIKYELLGIAEFIYLPLLICIYSIDRLIIKSEPMKKKFVIVLIVESVIVLLSLTYAYVQTVVAKETMRGLEAIKDELDKQQYENRKLAAELEELKKGK